jgi:hypothetical protein
VEIRWELKNKKTGKLYWLDDKEMEDLKRLGLSGRYLITEMRPLTQIKDPLQFEIKKSTIKHKKSD